MSIYSDYKAGALTDEEFRNLAAMENNKARFEEHQEEPERIRDDQEDKR